MSINKNTKLNIIMNKKNVKYVFGLLTLSENWN